MATIPCKAVSDYSPRKVRRGDVLELAPDDVLIQAGVCVPTAPSGDAPSGDTPSGDSLHAEHVGGGYFEIRRGAGDPLDRVKGKEAAQARLTELEGTDD